MKIGIQLIVIFILICLTLTACSGKKAASPPDTISLPNAFQPEGRFFGA